ncbi:MAG: ribonuclease H-like domain-containing protein [Bacteroidales bacterium]|nr:ribonuclease H-like domain-containing protein [Bacteroidales bacterium]
MNIIEIQAKLIMYTVIDIETTGLSPKKEKITEIAIYVYDGEKIIDEFISLVNPERPVPYFITRLTGITNEMLARAPKFYEIAKKIVEITENRIFVAHNVDFDYNFIKEEFARLGYEFQRKKLCTVKLSKKIIPGRKSYSLGKLTHELGIVINGRHRAAGDAYATVQLFEYLLKIDAQSKPLIEEISYHSMKGLHPEFDKGIIDKLPEKTGVYYFYDENSELIYIGKSINIHKRVLQHLSNSKTAKAVKMRSRIVDISFEETGSELIALLLESDEIKKHKPVFNRAQRRSFFQYGIYTFEDEQGYLRFEIRKNQGKEMPLTSYTSLQSAKSGLSAFCEEYELCQKLCGLYDTEGACFHYGIKQCKGACIGEELPADYNKRAKSLINKFEYESTNFLIIDKGRTAREKSVVKIEKGKYCGFGYFEPEITGDNVQLIAESTKPYNDNRDVQIIIKGFVSTNRLKLLKF